MRIYMFIYINKMLKNEHDYNNNQVYTWSLAGASYGDEHCTRSPHILVHHHDARCPRLKYVFKSVIKI